MGAENGVPYKANDGGAKAYVHSFGEALHHEFKPLGVYVTVVPTGLTNTPALAKLGFDPRTMPMKPMSVEQCVSEGLNALKANRSRIVPGRLNRVMNAFVPTSIKRTITAKMFRKALGDEPRNSDTSIGVLDPALVFRLTIAFRGVASSCVDVIAGL